MTKRSKLSNFWIWDFDIHLTFGFWHLSLMHSYFAKLHFLDPIIPSFQYSFQPLLHHSITPALERPSGAGQSQGLRSRILNKVSGLTRKKSTTRAGPSHSPQRSKSFFTSSLRTFPIVFLGSSWTRTTALGHFQLWRCCLQNR